MVNGISAWRRPTDSATAPAGGWRLRVAIMAAMDRLTARAAATLGTSPRPGSPTSFQHETPMMELMRLPMTAFHGCASGCGRRRDEGGGGRVSAAASGGLGPGARQASGRLTGSASECCGTRLSVGVARTARHVAVPHAALQR